MSRARDGRTPPPRSRRPRGVRTLAGLATLLLVGAAPSPAAGRAPGAAAAPGCADVIVSTKTFDVELRPKRKAYRRGQVAKVAVAVTRPAKEDPAGLGIGLDHPIASPADGVIVGMGLTRGNGFLSGSTRTNQNGRGLIRVRIPKRFPTGPVRASALAWLTHFRGACLVVEEFGHRQDPALFRVKR